MTTILIQQAEIMTMNENNDIVLGDMRIENECIKEIRPSLTPYPGEKVIEAYGRTILPGFIHTHIHLCQALFRSQADDLQLMDWLKERIWPMEAAHTPDSIYASAMLGIGELLRSGTTTIVDMETVHHTNAAFEAIEASGIRALSGKVMMDKGDELPAPLLETTSQSVQESADLYEKWNGRDNDRIRYAFSPRFVVSCSEPLLREVSRLSSHYGAYVHTHASESQGEIEIVEADTGMRNVMYLDHLGLVHPRLILAHCVWLDDHEKKVIKQKGAHISHCPSSNMKLASGFADIPDLLNHHHNVSLGADGSPCNNTLDMFQEMRMAALIHKPSYGPTAMNARQVLRMATIEGARAVGLDQEIGSIEIGKKADLSILNLYDFHTYPSEGADPYSRIVYAASKDQVETTIVNGRIVMQDRNMKTMNKDHVLSEANKEAKQLFRRASRYMSNSFA